MNIIALLGWKNSGKDTVAKYLKSNYRFTHLKFARYIKDAANSIFPNLPLTYNELQALDVPKGTNVTETYDHLDYWEIDKDTPREEFGGKTKRDVLIDLAKYLKSTYGDDIFVNNIHREIELLYEQNTNSNIVISDLRFMVEFDWLKTLKHNVIYFDIRKFPLDENIEIYTDYLKIVNTIVYDNSLNYKLLVNNGRSKPEFYKMIDNTMGSLKL